MKTNTVATGTNARIVYEAINKPVYALVPGTAKRILDVGCGSGSMGREIKKRQSCEIIGLTYSETEAAIAVQNIDRVLVCDLNNFNPNELGMFDCIICSHVLEHLYEPWTLLKALRGNLDQSGVLIVALPNVLNIKQRLEFLRGRFEYQEAGGLMDRTHMRFFDWDTSYDLVRNAGFEVHIRTSTGFFPLPVIRKLFNRAATRLDRLATKLMPRLFAFQFIIVARPAHI